MKPALDLETRYLEILQPILEPIKKDVYVFGSRVQGKAQKFSDLDLCYKGKHDKAVIRKIKESLRDSNLPFRVDLISHEDSDEDFKKLIKEDLMPLFS